MTAFDPNELIASYRAAYEAANGKRMPFTIAYEDGWFVATERGSETFRRQNWELANMRFALLARGSSPSRNSAQQEEGR